MIVAVIELNEETGKWGIAFYDFKSQQDYVGKLWNQEHRIFDVSQWDHSERMFKLSELNYKPIEMPERESKVPSCSDCGWSIYDGKNGNAKEGICFQCWRKKNPPPDPNTRFHESLKCIEHKSYPNK